MLKIAIQSKGRLNEKSVALLADAGITVGGTQRSLISRATGFPMEVLYLRDDDIPGAVASGVADLGIVGLNEVEEHQADVEVAMHLGFGKCRISLAVPKTELYQGLEWFSGRRVATSYPSILRRFFGEKGINAKIHFIAGSVEVAPAVGMADAIFDIVSSGGTLIQNGLKEVQEVFKSDAVLIANRGLSPQKRVELQKLMFRLESIIRSRGMKYVIMNLPAEAVDEAIALMPGMKSPTMIPLTEPGWYSFQVVIRESELWEKVEMLKDIGAEDILVLQLENVIR